VHVSSAPALLLVVLVLPLVAGVVAALRPSRATGLVPPALVAALATAAFLLVRALADASGTALELDGRPLLAADRLGALLAVFVLGMAVMVLAYARRYLACDPAADRFAAGASLLAAATVAVAFAADLWVLAAAWSLVSVATVSLIRHDGRTANRLAARRAAVRFAVGDLALFGAAAVATVAWGGRLPLAEGAQGAVVSGETAIAGLVGGLAVVAAVTRGALLPAHRWLAGTLHAPTPVSALLHAGVVNGGGILLVRLSPTFRESTVATLFAVGIGAISMVIALAAARTRPDVKGALVWSTTGQMGFMVVQAALGLIGPAVVHLLAHGMYKANLFLGAGGVVDRTARRHVHHPVMLRHALIGAAVGAGAVGLSLVVLDPPGATTGPGLVMAAFPAAAIAVGAAHVAATRHARTAVPLVLLTALAAPAYLAAVTVVEDDVLGAPHLAAAGATAAAVGVVAVSALGWLLLGTSAGTRTAPGRRAWSRVVSLAHPPERTPTRRPASETDRAAAGAAGSAVTVPSTPGTAGSQQRIDAAWRAA
jgi:NADH:ubiquinone oxidoreductase subunit 5 (subunit L)/multisubunit Na+/H+ antiporter MnhA subunit